MTSYSREVNKTLNPEDGLLPLCYGTGTFMLEDKVKKKSGSEWEGAVVGFYSTGLTPEGYAVESSSHKGSVQI